MLRRSTGLLLCLLTGTILFAQTDRAVLRGVVKDSSGAFVPSAQITVTEIQTNIQARTLLSDANGNYEVPDLKPTTYRVKADAPGFRSFIAQDVLLDAGQVRRVDITLEVGTASESITVEAGAALIQTDTGTISEELDTAKKYPATPFVDIYPSPFALMTTMPNVQGNGWAMVFAGISDRNKQTYAFDGDSQRHQRRSDGQSQLLRDGSGDHRERRCGQRPRRKLQHGFQARRQRFPRRRVLQEREQRAGRQPGHDSGHQEDPLPVPRVRSAGRRTHYQEPYVLLRGMDAPGDPARRQRNPDHADHAREIRQLHASLPPSRIPTTGNPFPGNIIPANRISPTAQAVINNYYANSNQRGAEQQLRLVLPVQLGFV